MNTHYGPWALVTGMAMIASGFTPLQAMGMNVIVNLVTPLLLHGIGSDKNVPVAVVGGALDLAGETPGLGVNPDEGAQGHLHPTVDDGAPEAGVAITVTTFAAPPASAATTGRPRSSSSKPLG